MSKLNILYEDNHIIAVYKPAGLLVQPASLSRSGEASARRADGGDKTGDKSLLDKVKEYLKQKYKKPGNVFLGLVHRLDRNVSGIVLFGKTSKGASRLSEQFRDNEIQKIYYAVAEGELESKKGKLIHYLAKNENIRKASVSDSAKENYEMSELEYEVVRSNKNYSLLKIKLITGRFHQIRAQFSHTGHPLVGDSKYGSKEKTQDNSVALCATEIEFRTATTDEVIKLKIKCPDFWEKYFK